MLALLSLGMALGLDAGVTAYRIERADAIVQQWAETRCDTHAVAATFTRFQYDGVFREGRSPEISFGDLYYAGPRDCHIGVGPRLDTCQGHESDEEIADFRNQRVQYSIWRESEFVELDTNAGRYEIYVLPPDGQGEGAQESAPPKGWLARTHWNLLHSTLPEQCCPFLPGLPDKNAVAKWRFLLVDETTEEIRLEARLLEADSALVRRCDLILKKPGPTLSAIRCHSPDSRIRTVYAFDDVEFNPAARPVIDTGGLQPCRHE